MSNDIRAAGSLIQIISQSRQNALKKKLQELFNMPLLEDGDLL